MKSNLEGCVRMCETCPKRALRGVFLDPTIVAQIRNNIVQGNDHIDEDLHFPEIDPLELDSPFTHRIASISDYGNLDANTLDYLIFTRKGMSFQTYPFPVTTTLEMIGACTGPEKIKRGLFRSSMQCGAYQEGMRVVAELMKDDPESLHAYTAFVEHEDEMEHSRPRNR